MDSPRRYWNNSNSYITSLSVPRSVTILLSLSTHVQTLIFYVKSKGFSFFFFQTFFVWYEFNVVIN